MASLQFSPRQEEVLTLIAEGLTDKEIAARLGVHRRTVRTYLERLFARHGLHNRAAAVTYWLRAGMSLSGTGVGINHDLPSL